MAAVARGVRRIGHVPVSPAAFAAGGTALAIVLALGTAPFWTAAACLVLFCADFTGRAMAGHLLGGPEPWPDRSRRSRRWPPC